MIYTEIRDKQVAIVMPCYNSWLTIPRAIAAIQNQIHYNWTLYIVDDASTDSSVDVIKDFIKRDSRIVLIENRNNRGPSFARNTAIEAIKEKESSFDYAAYCDADDFWWPTHLEHSLLKLHETGSDIVYSDIVEIHITHLEGFMFGIKHSPVFDRDAILKGNYIYISTVVHKVGMLQEFDSSLDSIEDWDMWYRFAKANYDFVHLCEKDTTYTVRNDSMAARVGDKKQIFDIKYGL